MSFRIYIVLNLCYIIYFTTGSRISNRLGGAVKPWEKKNDSVSQLIRHKGVCRAAPGFARFCSKCYPLVQDLGYSFAFHSRIPGCPEHTKRSLSMASFKPFVNMAMPGFKPFVHQRSFVNQQSWGKRSQEDPALEEEQLEETQQEKKKMWLLRIKLLNAILG